MTRLTDVEIVIELKNSTESKLLAKVKIKIPLLTNQGEKFYFVSKGWVVRSSDRNIPDGIRGNCFVSAPSVPNKFGKYSPLIFFEDLHDKANIDAFKELTQQILREYYARIGQLPKNHK